ncbi:MAG: glycosyltransferase family 2 protein [Actinomycetota bacterium]
MSDAPAMGEVSICIPVFNGAAHLDEALRSARSQTVSPLEILVVDDQSSDGSLAIAERHAAEDPRIRIERNRENMGLAANWQRAVELSRGRWVKFLFQDDLIAPSCLARLCAGVDQSGAVLAFVGRRVMAEGLTPGQARSLAPIERRNLCTMLERSAFLPPERVAELALNYWAINVLGEPTSAMVRRDVFDRHGPFDANLTQLCDWEYWIRVGASEGLWFEVEKLATFRIHPHGTSLGNRREQAVWTTYGETALLGWKFLRDEAFAPVRVAAERAVPPVDLAARVARHVLRFDVNSDADRTGRGAALAAMERRYGPLPAVPVRAAILERSWMRLPAWIRMPVHRLRLRGRRRATTSSSGRLRRSL